MTMKMKISMLLLQTLPHERGGKQKNLDQVSSVHLPLLPPSLILVVIASKRETPVFRSASNDSESDTYGGSRARNLIKKNRRRQMDALPVPAARWSNRRAAQVSAGAYQESEADEEDSEMMTPIQALRDTRIILLISKLFSNTGPRTVSTSVCRAQHVMTSSITLNGKGSHITMPHGRMQFI